MVPKSHESHKVHTFKKKIFKHKAVGVFFVWNVKCWNICKMTTRKSMVEIKKIFWKWWTCNQNCKKNCCDHFADNLSAKPRPGPGLAGLAQARAKNKKKTEITTLSPEIRCFLLRRLRASALGLLRNDPLRPLRGGPCGELPLRGAK